MHYISFKLSKQETEGLKPFLDKVAFDRKRDEVWVVKLDRHLKLYLLNNRFPLLFEKEKVVFPTMVSAKLFEEYYSQAVVDKGAIPHILNGADLMAPGIVSFSQKGPGEIVLIKGEDGLILAIGRLLQGFREALDKRRGKVAENLHYLNDRLHQFLMARYHIRPPNDKTSSV